MSFRFIEAGVDAACLDGIEDRSKPQDYWDFSFLCERAEQRNRRA